MGIDFRKIEIFKTGNWNNKQHTLEMLQDAVRCQKDLKGNVLPDLKFSHQEDKEKRDKKFPYFKDYPFSLGKADNFSVEENVLYSDYINVLPEIKKLIESKQITTHSCEIYYNVTFPNGSFYKMVISAIALLEAGTFPALVTEFQPYMYAGDFLKDCTFEEKAIYQINNSNVPEEEKGKMNKKMFELAKSNYEKNGVQCMAYEDFIKLDENAQNAYIDDLEAKLIEAMKTLEGQENSSTDMAQFQLQVQKEVQKEVQKAMDDLRATTKIAKEAFSLSAQTSQVKDQAYSQLENEIKALKNLNRKAEVEKLVFSLTRVDNPKLPAGLESVAVELLMNADETEKMNFSFNGNTVKSQKALLEKLFQNLPSIQKSKTTKEVFSMDGVTVNDTLRAEYGEDVPDSLIVEDQKVKTYALDHNLTYDQAYEKLNFSM